MNIRKNLSSTELACSTSGTTLPVIVSKPAKSVQPKPALTNLKMTKSYHFNINYALDYTCHRQIGNEKSINFCGQCNSCQIVTNLNNLKQWFDRASHIALKKFLNGLIVRINNIKIYKYLNDLLKPLTESKDFIYARNGKFLPSCDEDQLKPTNNRCLDKEYINKQMNDVWTWFSNSNGFIKLNFILSLLNKCEQGLLFVIILQVRSIIDTAHADTNDMINEDSEYLNDYNFRVNKLSVDDSEAEIVCEAYDDEEDHQLKKDDQEVQNILNEEKTRLKGSNPRYANNMDVKVPNLYPGSSETKRKNSEREVNVSYKSECNWENAYAGYETRNVIMEERNVFCGAYNVLLLKEKRDPHRVTHFNGKNLISMASFDKKIRFIDLRTSNERQSSIQGHAGSVTCLYICEEKRIVITGSYDTSIRCWSIDTGKCLKIYQGHQQTITCISMYDEHERLISGSADKTCKVWNLNKKKCWRTFKHSYPIASVAIGEEICVTGGQSGKLKVFHLFTGQLIKTISAHQGPITAIKFDRWHILSCSTDGYALVFSTQGKHKKCIIAMRHPKEVLCLEFQYLRAITGSADGKIRIWNILNGDCIRVMRGNSMCDPISSMSIVDNRILVNTENNVILMEFEVIQYEYGTNRDEATTEPSLTNMEQSQQQTITKRNKNYSAIRASRMELVGTPNVKLFNDDRKSVLGQSSRPISAKCFKDARFIHKIVAKNAQSELRKNSAGHISESALIKRRSVMRSINAIISNNGSMSILSSSNANTDFSNRLDKLTNDFTSSGNNDEELDSARPRPFDLGETKQYLREQLKEIKQTEQHQFSSQETFDSKNLTKKDQIETKSCVEASATSRLMRIFHFAPNDSLSSSLRPTSSPSRVDTKTKIKLKTHDLSRLTNQRFESEIDSSKLSPKIDESSRNNLNNNKDSKTATQTTQTFITKIFDAQETDLKSNANMFPVNVKSKIPNPKIINLIRPQTVLTGEKNVDNSMPLMARSKSAVPIKQAEQPQQQQKNYFINRPKTSATITKRNFVSETNLETLETSNKLASNNNLNLMTYKEIDQIMDTINGFYATPDLEKEKRQAEIYKKLWVLKSKGQYHGSLLAKPKTVAPEIRE